jgi:hypothetical protein
MEPVDLTLELKRTLVCWETQVYSEKEVNRGDAANTRYKTRYRYSALIATIRANSANLL